MLLFGLPAGALPVKLDTGETQTLIGSFRSDRFGILCLINQGNNDRSADCFYTASAGSEILISLAWVPIESQDLLSFRGANINLG